MPVRFNIRHLEEKTLSLKDELAVAELDLAGVDELIHPRQPLLYHLQVERFERGILAHGSLRLRLECECARCLRTFSYPLDLEDWACHLALEGEEKVSIINDLVDLTPYIREDILLAFPQRPLCEPECKGLAIPRNEQRKPGISREPESASATWAELNKLKF